MGAHNAPCGRRSGRRGRSKSLTGRKTEAVCNPDVSRVRKEHPGVPPSHRIAWSSCSGAGGPEHGTALVRRGGDGAVQFSFSFSLTVRCGTTDGVEGSAPWILDRRFWREAASGRRDMELVSSQPFGRIEGWKEFLEDARRAQGVLIRSIRQTPCPFQERVKQLQQELRSQSLNASSRKS